MGWCLRAVALLYAATAPAHVLRAQAAADFARADSAIVRLEPSAFTALPSPIRRDLERRGCRVPQSFADTRPHNVVRGALSGPGPNDWAVLCSIAGTSRVLIYGGAPRPGGAGPDSLALQPDATYLQSGVQDGSPWRIGFSRRITVATPTLIRSYAKGSRASVSRVDHAGIEDSFLEKASRIFYFSAGRWRMFPGAD